eukprot:s2212_g10.t1
MQDLNQLKFTKGAKFAPAQDVFFWPWPAFHGSQLGAHTSWFRAPSCHRLGGLKDIDIYGSSSAAGSPTGGSEQLRADVGINSWSSFLILSRRMAVEKGVHHIEMALERNLNAVRATLEMLVEMWNPHLVLLIVGRSQQCQDGTYLDKRGLQLDHMLAPRDQREVAPGVEREIQVGATDHREGPEINEKWRPEWNEKYKWEPPITEKAYYTSTRYPEGN